VRHQPTYYGSHGVMRCDKCDTAWPCEYEQGWRAALREAADHFTESPLVMTTVEQFEFANWLRARAAEALREAADDMSDDLRFVYAVPWLRARADAEEGK